MSMAHPHTHRHVHKYERVHVNESCQAGREQKRVKSERGLDSSAAALWSSMLEYGLTARR